MSDARTDKTPSKRTNRRGGSLRAGVTPVEESVHRAERTEKESEVMATKTLLREHAEQQFAEELEELAKVDTRQRPPNWKLSPWAVTTYMVGGSWIMVLLCRLSILVIAA